MDKQTRKNLDIIQKGYTEETRDLDFTVELSTGRDFIKAVEIVDSYNEFDSELIKEQYKKHLLPLDGKLIYQFGRENSPILYITFTGTDAEWFEAKGEIEKFADYSLANEITHGGRYGARTYRIWWD